MALAERLLRRPSSAERRAPLKVVRREFRSDPPASQIGVVELRAAAMLVASGASPRVTLANVRSRPGLLWQAERIAREEAVEIVVLASRPNGTIDLRVGPRCEGEYERTRTGDG